MKPGGDYVCRTCGQQIHDAAAICMKCGVPTGVGAVPVLTAESRSRVVYVVLGFFLGNFGVHNFYAGYTGKAVAQLLISLLIGWLILPWFAVWLWSIIEICVVTHDADGQAFV